MLYLAIPILIIAVIFHFCQKGVEQQDEQELRRKR